MLIEMGFDIKVARHALDQAKNNMDKALDLLREHEIDGGVSP